MPRRQHMDGVSAQVIEDDLLPVIGRTTAPIYSRLEGFARSRVTILLRGSTGTGKSRLAAWVHHRSPRREKPFVEADLYGGPSGLAASALLGHRRGAFTGATETRRGRLMEAHGGTLFLDEIDKLDLQEQALLLRVIERKAVRELGGEALNADVRLIVGTNANLEQEVKARRFREDLYYRINAAPFFLPDLDERPDEIVPWALYMLQEVHTEYTEGGRLAEVRFSDSALYLLQTCRWPGNLRQLRYVIERAWLMAQHDATRETLIVEAGHIECALLLDQPGEPHRSPAPASKVVAQLEQAARTCAAHVLLRAEQGREPVPLTAWEGFAGLVVDAVRQLRPLDKSSASLFGLESQISGGNYLKTYQRLQLRGHSLLDALLHEERAQEPHDVRDGAA